MDPVTNINLKVINHIDGRRWRCWRCDFTLAGGRVLHDYL